MVDLSAGLADCSWAAAASLLPPASRAPRAHTRTNPVHLKAYAHRILVRRQSLQQLLACLPHGSLVVRPSVSPSICLCPSPSFPPPVVPLARASFPAATQQRTQAQHKWHPVRRCGRPSQSVAYRRRLPSRPPFLHLCAWLLNPPNDDTTARAHATQQHTQPCNRPLQTVTHLQPPHPRQLPLLRPSALSHLPPPPLTPLRLHRTTTSVACSNWWTAWGLRR